MYRFSSNHRVLAAGRLDFAIARKDDNEYFVVYAYSSGHIPYREVAHLNSTTAASQLLPTSPEGRLCLWIDPDLERDPRNLAEHGSILIAILEGEPRPPFKPTGRKQIMDGLEGGEREATEVELLLSEEELAHYCYYCGGVENAWDGDDRFERHSGEGYGSTYCCPNCVRLSRPVRILSRVLRRRSIW